MNDELTKSLTQLIDETLQELEELKKSRFDAHEIDLHEKDDGIAGHEANGKIKKEEDEEEHEEEHEDKEEAEKAEHAKKADDEEEEDEDEEAEKADCVDKGEDDPADAPEVSHKLKGLMGKKEEKEPHKEDPHHEEKEKKLARKLLDMHKKEKHEHKDMEKYDMKGMKKSIIEESSELMKSLIDERVAPLEEKLSVILNLVNKIADQPVSPRGVTARTAPLLKSVDENEGETLSKSQVASKLFELKKSGSPVDSLDVAKAEMGQDLGVIVKKYKLS